MRKVAARDARGRVIHGAGASRDGRTLVPTLSEQPRDDHTRDAVVIHEQDVHLVGGRARHGRPTSLADVTRTADVRFPASRGTTRRPPSRASAFPAPPPASPREPTERAPVFAPSRPRRASQWRAPGAKTSLLAVSFRSRCVAYPLLMREKAHFDGHVDRRLSQTSRGRLTDVFLSRKISNAELASRVPRRVFETRGEMETLPRFRLSSHTRPHPPKDFASARCLAFPGFG